MTVSQKNRQRGSSLIEMLVSLFIMGIASSTLMTTFVARNRAYTDGVRMTEMMQNTRVSMGVMTYEVRMAGYDPTNAGIIGIPYDSSQLQIRSDLNQDGDADDINEDIIYVFNSAYHQIERTAAGQTQALIKNVQNLSFEYLDENADPTTTTAEIRQVRIQITAKTAHADPNYSENGGYRTYSLSSVVVPRNLAL